MRGFVKNRITSIFPLKNTLFFGKTAQNELHSKNMNLFDRIPTRKPRTKKEMIEYLNSHFRYHTLRSWNRMTSYAHNVKIYNLPWRSNDDESKAYDLVSTALAARVIQKHLDEFNRRTDYRYSIITGGRSGGYFVLVRSERTDSGYKSECPECGGLNYRLIPPDAGTLDNLIVRQPLKGWTNETILREPAVTGFAATEGEKQNALLRLRPIYKDFSAGAKCGKCGCERRENLSALVYQTAIHFAGIDEGEDFDEWSKDELQARVETVFLFDQTVRRTALDFIKFVETHRPEEAIRYRPETETIAVPINS